MESKYLTLAESVGATEIVHFLNHPLDYEDAMTLIRFCSELGFVPCGEFESKLVNCLPFSTISLVKYYCHGLKFDSLRIIEDKFGLKAIELDTYPGLRSTETYDYKGFVVVIRSMNLCRLIKRYC